jgi:hypothetical protein
MQVLTQNFSLWRGGDLEALNSLYLILKSML